MELVSIFTYLGLYTHLLFMDRLPKCNINYRLHLAILFKMYNNVNFNNQKNISSYIRTLKFLNKLDDNEIEYTIYIDNWGCFRRIIISSLNKIVHIKDMYF
jgi:hypothetical protein